MPRGPSGPSKPNRLLNLLFKETVPVTKFRLPLVKRVLYENDTSKPGQSSKRSSSVLDDLLQYEWQQKPLEKAAKDLRQLLPHLPRSNVLRLNCPHTLINADDLHNILPRPKERHYVMNGPLKKGLKFHVVKGRNPLTLMFLGFYYLVFPNYIQACAYYLETKHKILNGLPIDLSFVALDSLQLKHMSSPHFRPGQVLNQSSQTQSSSDLPTSQTSPQTPNVASANNALDKVFKDSPIFLEVAKKLEQAGVNRSAYKKFEIDPIYQIMYSYLCVPERYSMVLARNLPFGISTAALERLLWDYEFSTELNPQASISTLHSDPESQATLVLLKFKDEKNARRFVRNFHGRKWDKMLSRKTKSLHDPILCEIVD